MGISLMTDIEDERILTDIKNLMHGNDQVHRTHARAEMSSGLADSSEDLLSYLFSQGSQFFYTVCADICHFVSFFI